MLPPLEEIEKRRKSLGLTQKELAKLVNLSQSMIAKIECGKLNPSYLKVKLIFDTLEKLEKKITLKAEDLLHEEVVGIEKDDSISKAVNLMLEKGYSQLPVFDRGKSVGSITEKTVLEQILKSDDVSKLSSMSVESIMESSFPCVDMDAPLQVISTLLRYSSAVLITERGKIRGIITKADLLRVIKG
ncbi:MAG: CBS domain-containing protein [Candidatus Bathyarchaeia archaeon]|nr:CBS domain-containing protein [Candidatus Bathyarchaeota archaeon]